MANNEEKLNTFIEDTKTLENKLNNESKNWTKIVNQQTKNIYGDIKKIIEHQAEIISYNQIASEEVKSYALLLSKNNTQIKELIKQRYEFYSTKYQLNVKNDTAKKSLVESDIARIRQRSELLEIHIQFLRDTVSNLESLNYAVKNRIELMNALGL
ncbi:MAG: recombination mediator protein UvsY [Saccharofermentanales bacterium]